ncbi:uncharacterized protein LOC141692575 [Apium graveolens]|uniref:uncharacterized protein LOC141692575 n=1 Tax=Apium graveolens TaxID=4045 RepID=UPI003D7BFF19
MASQKHLRELLRQDQEPFYLHNYIADKRNSHLNKPKNKPAKPPTKSTTSKRASLYKQACFTSFQDSPDFLKSPLKKKNSGTVLHVPPKTAAGLLEAATKIHNQSSSKPKNVRFAGLFFGSILRKLKDKNTSTSKTRELSSSSSINGPGFEAKQDQYVVDNSKDKYEMGFAFSDCNYSNISRRISSAGWSEINTPEEDNKSLDMDTNSSCTSTSRSDFYTHDFVLPDQPHHFCLSPLSPFRFALQRSPSVGRRTPEFLSPSTSPCRHRSQEDDDQATDNLKNQTQEEDEKDQFSPVSVLDLPFEDDEQEDGRGEEEEEEVEDEDDYDLECSYALMQKAKFQLLEKLRRFERLAELEPIELEKRMLEGYEDEDEDDYYLDENEEYEVVDEFGINVDDLICKILSPCNLEKVPGHMKRLVTDLIAEEKKNGMDNKNEVMVKIVSKRLDSWKEVESNTIDMMVGVDLIRELDGWKSYDEVGERAKEIELAIFGLLMEEISEELVRH